MPDKTHDSQALKMSLFSKPQLLIFVLVFAAIGGYILYRSFAAGPTIFGITTAGSTSDAATADQKQVGPYNSPQAGSVSKITGFISGLGATSGTQNLKAIIYADSSGAPGALLGVSNAVTVNAGQAMAPVDFTFSSPVAVNAGTVWMGYISSTTSRLTLISANVLGSNNLIFAPNTGGYAAGPTNPFGGNQSSNAYQYAMYATYVATSGGSTFGITTAGSTSDAATADQKQVGPYTSPQAGLISKITGFISGLGAASGTQNVKAVIYADSSGVPGALLGVSNAVTVNAGQAMAPVDFTFSSPVAVNAGTVWMGYISSTTSRLTLISANVLGSNNLIFAPNTGGYTAGPTDPFGGNQSTNAYQYALYATYASSALPGDVNNDGSVNGQDVAAVVSNWGATSGSSDVNSDGTVNTLDLSIVLTNFGTVYTPKPTVNINALPTSISSGASSNLSWSSTNATSCTASDDWSGTKATSGNNVSTGALSTTSKFTITCTGPGGTSAPSSVTVTVTTSGGGIGGTGAVYWGAYIKGDSYTYYFGGAWLDAPWDTNTWNKFETDAGKKTSLIMFGQKRFWFQPFNYDGAFDVAMAHGAIPVVDMSTGLDSTDNPTPFSNVTSGMYDTQITQWAQAAKAWRHPFFLRLDAEMNGHWYAYGQQAQADPQGFINMWRHIHDIFTTVGANNVSWHWCPNDDTLDPQFPLTPLESLYPGDAYVDWIGMTGYSHYDTEPLSYVFDGTYNRLVALAPNKPIQIGETGAVDVDFPGNKVRYIQDFFAALAATGKYNHVRAFCWFNWRIDEGHGIWDWPIESSATGQAAFQSGISSSHYVAGTPTLESSLPLDQKVPVP